MIGFLGNYKEAKILKNYLQTEATHLAPDISIQQLRTIVMKF